MAPSIKYTIMHIIYLQCIIGDSKDSMFFWEYVYYCIAALVESGESGRGSTWAVPSDWSPVHIERQRGTFTWFMLSSVKIHSLSACVRARRAHDM